MPTCIQRQTYMHAQHAYMSTKPTTSEPPTPTSAPDYKFRERTNLVESTTLNRDNLCREIGRTVRREFASTVPLWQTLRRKAAKSYMCRRTMRHKSQPSVQLSRNQREVNLGSADAAAAAVREFWLSHNKTASVMTRGPSHGTSSRCPSLPRRIISPMSYEHAG